MINRQLRILLLMLGLGASTASCTPIARLHADRSVTIVDKADECLFISEVNIPKSYFTKPRPENDLRTIRILKWDAHKIGGNAISDIKLKNRDFPVGTARAYKCPQHIIDRDKDLRDNEEKIRQLIQWEE